MLIGRLLMLIREMVVFEMLLRWFLERERLEIVFGLVFLVCLWMFFRVFNNFRIFRISLLWSMICLVFVFLIRILMDIIFIFVNKFCGQCFIIRFLIILRVRYMRIIYGNIMLMLIKCLLMLLLRIGSGVMLFGFMIIIFFWFLVWYERSCQKLRFVFFFMWFFCYLRCFVVWWFGNSCWKVCLVLI